MAQLVGNLIADHPALSGLYQVTASAVSKHDLLCLIRDVYGLNIDIIPDEKEVSDRSMAGEKFRKATGYSAPEWPGLVEQLAGDPTPYEDWR
jgi:dTDP-4-dehydrorhamnose reductase